MGTQFERFGDIYKATFDGASAYVTRDPGHAEHVLRTNWQNYVKGRSIKRIGLLLGNGLMVSEGEFWKKQRRMIQPAFLRQAIAGLTPVIVEANLELMEAWQAAARKNETVNVTRDLSRMLLKVVLVSIFGNDYEDARPHFDLLSGEPTRNLEFAEAFKSTDEIVIAIAGRRRAHGYVSADILGMLMSARDLDTGAAMPDDQLANEVKTLIVAGHETTASTLNWMWYLLSQHREVDQKLGRELEGLTAGESFESDRLAKFTYTRQIIEEAMRLYPAGWLVTRRAVGDDRLGDYVVPARTEIHIPIYFIQRHPDLWDSPDRFDPDRFGTDRSAVRHRLATLPFSAGPRNCIGESLARVEMQIHLMTVARRLKLNYIGKNPPEFDVGINLRSKDDFVMAPELKSDPRRDYR